MSNAMIKYDNAISLTQAIEFAKTTTPYLVTTFFSSEEMHPTDTFALELFTSENGIAQFVKSDSADPVVVGKKGSKSILLTIPMTKEKKIFTAYELVQLKALNPGFVNNTSDITNRANKYITDQLSALKERVITRREQMAAEILTTGKYAVEQDNVSFSYDFGFVDGKQLVNAGKMWTEATANPLNDLRDWKRSVTSECGAAPTIVIMGLNASQLFINNEKVMKRLDNLNYKVGGIDLTTDIGVATYIGTFAGMKIFEYSQTYVDNAGNAKEMFDPNKVLIAAPNRPLAFKMHKAAIPEISGSGSLALQTSDIYVKPKIIDDTIEWKASQKSMPAVQMPTALLVATVCTGETVQSVAASTTTTTTTGKTGA